MAEFKLLGIIFSFFLLVVQCRCSDILAHQSLGNGFGYAVDVYQSVSLKSFQCIKTSGYTVAFIRAYARGQVDRAVKDNVINANSAGLGIEIFVQPNPNGKAASKQFDDVLEYLQRSSISAKRIWLLVSDPMSWSKSSSSKIGFINDFYNRATSRQYDVGVYTNWYDWLLITGGYRGLSSSVHLWYWNVLGQGPSAETHFDFSNFRPFGYWTQPFVKQFGIIESTCGVSINRSSFRTNSLSPSTNAGNSSEIGSAVKLVKNSQLNEEEFGL